MSGGRIAIVGGGISGLAAAHRIGELACEGSGPAEVTLFEAGDRLGGHLRTIRSGDLLVEAGPDQLVTHKPAGLDLVRRLGLADELIEIRGPRFAPRVLHRGRPTPLPDGFAMIAPTTVGALLRSRLFSWRAKARIAMEPLVPRRSDPGDESLAAFMSRRFGRELLDRIAEPILGGIFTADVDRLSMQMSLPRYLALERQHGSITRGMRRALGAARPSPTGRPAGLVVLKRGFGSLVSELMERLAGVTIRSRTPVSRVTRRGDVWSVEIEGRASGEFDQVVLACPAFVSARLLEWDSRLNELLRNVTYAGCATVYLRYGNAALSRPLEGSGHFVPRTARQPVLACSYTTNKFPDRAPAGATVLRVFLGGARHPEIPDLDERTLAEIARDHVRESLGISERPQNVICFRHPRAIPQFEVGHRDRLAELARGLERYAGLLVCGGADGATGLPDCIASGQRAGEVALERAVRSAGQPVRSS